MIQKLCFLVILVFIIRPAISKPLDVFNEPYFNTYERIGTFEPAILDKSGPIRGSSCNLNKYYSLRVPGFWEDYFRLNRLKLAGSSIDRHMDFMTLPSEYREIWQIFDELQNITDAGEDTSGTPAEGRLNELCLQSPGYACVESSPSVTPVPLLDPSPGDTPPPVTPNPVINPSGDAPSLGHTYLFHSRRPMLKVTLPPTAPPSPVVTLPPVPTSPSVTCQCMTDPIRTVWQEAEKGCYLLEGEYCYRAFLGEIPSAQVEIPWPCQEGTECSMTSRRCDKVNLERYEKNWWNFGLYGVDNYYKVWDPPKAYGEYGVPKSNYEEDQ